MPAPNRRQFLQTSAAIGGSWLAQAAFLQAETQQPTGNLGLSTFRFDVTPPKGHSLCGGWIKPVLGVDDPLEAIGFVLTGFGKPVVICVLDLCSLLNAAHLKFRETLADAAGTTPDRVTIHCVHQHNAPFACLDAEEIVSQYDLPHIVEPGYFNNCLDKAHAAVTVGLKQTQAVTHIATGMGEVKKVAGNRRLIGLNNQVVSQRGSSSKLPMHHQYPEGLIDPFLRTVAFYNGEKKIAACHYYACHPMSYYGDGQVSSDFCGLARKQRQQDEPECQHLYFNGCGGNIGAGKYNNGTPALRPVLTKRIYEGIVASEKDLQPEPIRSLAWSTQEILPPPQDHWDAEAIAAQIADDSRRVVERNRPAYTLAWLKRFARQDPIVLSGLHINNASLLHFPSESFIEYQLRAQAAAPDRFVACAAYGDGGPWYIPVKEAYPQGGYAVSVAWCDSQIDDLMCNGMAEILHSAT